MVGITVLMAPIVYFLSTVSRGHNAGESILDLMKKIVSRCSRLELAGIPLYEFDHGLYDESLFNQKFGLQRQIELIINAFFPGDIFEGDVMPNQYYRSVFLGLSEKISKENYVSINMTFPSYLIIKYGMLFAIAASVLLIFLLFVLSELLRKYTFSRIIPIMVMTDVLDFFDWVYIMQRIFIIFCTIGFFWLIRWVLKGKRLLFIRIKIKKKTWYGDEARSV